jgi:hypothetical protein
MTEQDNRQYAASLLNRADQPFDVRDLAMVAKVVELVEGDVADWLSSNLRGTVSREQIVAAVRAGSNRPEMPPIKPAVASLEGKSS